ncbi:MAG: hypothetical protein ACK5LV_08520 [Lachnospirales bacterium]
MKKRNFAEIEKGKRIQQFIDYYLLKLVIFIFSTCLFGFILYSVFREKPINMLSVAVIDGELNTTKTEDFEKEFLYLYDTLYEDEEKYVSIDNSYYSNGGALNKIQIQIMNSQLDVIIAQEDFFETLANYGYFKELDQSQFDEDDIFYSEKKQDDEGTDDDIVMPYGVRISCIKSELYFGYGYGDDYIVGIVDNTKNEENSYNFLKLLCNEK